MMANKMLIDASHPEETRVVVVRGSKVEEFDFESSSRKQLRGNIYLAKVTRVEPSLQAAFVNYGGNRQGFLAFNEIHPDYYQIPIADREALLEEYARAHHSDQNDEGRSYKKKWTEKKSNFSGRALHQSDTNENFPSPDGIDEEFDNGYISSNISSNGSSTFESQIDPEDSEDDVENIIEQLGEGDALDDVPDRPRPSRRQYKIQEVIKRNQLLLIQVVKEERGNKGAALTTYLSLAGRYSVLMPNTGRGGGISRKITNIQDRKRLKEIAQELDVPQGMGIILRTAGASRTKTEIKRDFEYLMRLWVSVRDLTMTSSAPLLVYEEGSLIKRAIRDLYNKDIDEVLVSGDDAYREAKDFMRMLMPSHARFVQPYKEPTPLFARYHVESQLDAMFSNHVQLKSGGYLVINPTEALVSIDVNSGRSTKEHNIEDTAIRTNLEAAEEVARQLRLRDLAGLIVIDFIDMEEKRNNRSVEKRLTDCLKNDRARIQIGRISPFGLLEMSRQRIRTGVLESSSIPCPHCMGTGFLRSTPSSALNLLRSVEENLISNSAFDLHIKTKTDIAFYILNHKRDILHDLEIRFNVALFIEADDHLANNMPFIIERGEVSSKQNIKTSHHSHVNPMSSQETSTPVLPTNEKHGKKDEDTKAQQKDLDSPKEAVLLEEEPLSSSTESDYDSANRRRKRRRRGRNGRRERQFSDQNQNTSFESQSITQESVEEVILSSNEVVIENLSAKVEESAPSLKEAPAKKKKTPVKKSSPKTVKVKDQEGRSEKHLSELEITEGLTQPEMKVKKPTTSRKKTTVPEDAVVEMDSKKKPTKTQTKKEVKPDNNEAVKKEVNSKSALTKKKKESETLSEDKEKPKRTIRRTSKKTAEKIQEVIKASSKTSSSPSVAVAEKDIVKQEEPMAIALTPPDPKRPKRAGWWSKQK